jgi:hypothetical protein
MNAKRPSMIQFGKRWLPPARSGPSAMNGPASFGEV